MKRRWKSLVILLGVAALLLLFFMAWWWIRWPEKVTNKFFRLVSEEKFETANGLLAPPANWFDLARKDAKELQVSELIAQHKKMLRGVRGVEFELKTEEWKKFFNSNRFEIHPRAFKDYLVGRLVLETLIPPEATGGIIPAGVRTFSVSIVLTVERGRIFVVLTKKQGPIPW